MTSALTIDPQDTAVFGREILDQKSCRQIVPSLNEPVSVYHYSHLQNGWTFSIGTHVLPKTAGDEPRLSLGGFRIVPADRAALPGFSTQREAIELAIGMEEKVYWSKVCRVGGPIGIKNLGRIVGGKCVLLAAPDGRIGQAGDFTALDFAIACLKDFEEHSGILIITGQDMGHGTMSDGKTSSLVYLNRNFRGSVLEDTSRPTAEGNYYMLKGMLEACGLSLDASRVGLIGVGNIGAYLLSRLLDAGTEVLALESAPKRRAELESRGVRVFGPEQKSNFLAQPMDALAVNASGGSLDNDAIESISANGSIRLICGCENLAMPVENGEERLRAARKLYCHTELCGMMGYLTAVEEYLARAQGVRYTVDSMFEAARRLEEVGRTTAKSVLDQNFKETFSAAARRLFAGG